MRCPECLKVGQRSSVYPGCGGGASVWHAGFWDENDVWHSHAERIKSESYSCSRAHEWRDRYSTRTCPAPDCEWVKQKAAA